MPNITTGLIAVGLLVPFVAATGMLQCADGHRQSADVQWIDGRAPLLQFATVGAQGLVAGQATRAARDAIITIAAR